MRSSVAIALVLLAVAFPATAEIYRWVDTQGRVHYSDRPVLGAQRVSISSRASDPRAIAERNEAERQNREQMQTRERAQRQDQAAAKQVRQDMAKIDAERCTKAKDAYRIATESQRLYRMGKDGEREYLTDEEITTARINALKARDEACNPTK